MELWGGYLKNLKDAIQQGTEKYSYTSEYLKKRTTTGQLDRDVPGRGLTKDGWLRDTLLAYTSGTILGEWNSIGSWLFTWADGFSTTTEAGTDTTSTTMRIFILFMLNYPDVLRRLRGEIDSVVGSDRMPDWEDEPQLPYLTACIKEAMRCRPAIPMVRTFYWKLNSFTEPYSREYLTAPMRMMFGMDTTFPKAQLSSAMFGRYTWILIHTQTPRNMIQIGSLESKQVRTQTTGTSWVRRIICQDSPLTWIDDSYAFGWGRRFW